MKPESPVACTPETAADAWMGLLAMRGVDYLFANGGTDFAPVVEAFAKGEKLGWRPPEIVIVPHENMGIAMAHGYAMVTGRPQAMMVHVGVGTANTINGLINASRTNIPILLTAGGAPANTHPPPPHPPPPHPPPPPRGGRPPAPRRNGAPPPARAGHWSARAT